MCLAASGGANPTLPRWQAPRQRRRGWWRCRWPGSPASRCSCSSATLWPARSTRPSLLSALSLASALAHARVAAAFAAAVVRRAGGGFALGIAAGAPRRAWPSSLPRALEGPRPGRHRRRRQPAAAGRRAACAFASRSTRAALPAGVPRAARARLVRGLPRGRGARPAAPDAARRPALALHGAPAPAARQPQPARLRLRAVAVRAGRARHRLRARTAPGRAALLDATRRPSGRAAAPARARRDLRARAPIAALAGVLAALAVGDQAAIERDDWDLFRNTGVAHLMSHQRPARHDVRVARRRAGRRGCGGAARARCCGCRRRSAARWGGLRAATAYALFAGWGVPAQRTVWMLADAWRCCSRPALRWPWPLVLLARGAVVVTLLDPWALLQPGFWLSFVAVGLLMARRRDGAPHGAGDAAGWRAGRRSRRCAPACARRWSRRSAWRR